MKHARELAEIAQGVLAGKQYKVERKPFRDDVIAIWRANAEAASPEVD
ncbi:MAG: hypothetical protein H0W35_05755 [Actinobacteria bacterium]|nr:hypothetical protein [Actinomycetota bacterium]MBA3566962.1 hypothetical protein [Actinomycetota bacterium]